MQSWGLTDPGCVRKQNQDAFLIEQLDRNSLLCVVCDGMGGAKSGNIAGLRPAHAVANNAQQAVSVQLLQLIDVLILAPNATRICDAPILHLNPLLSA